MENIPPSTCMGFPNRCIGSGFLRFAPKLKRMKRHFPLILIGLGILLLIFGFAYDLVFAGIPYQDPTPTMSARYAFHSRIAFGFYMIGGGAFLVGVLGGVMRVITRCVSGPRVS